MNNPAVALFGILGGYILFDFLTFAVVFWIFMAILGLFGVHWGYYINHPWIATFVACVIWSLISFAMRR